jgi:hypothetical protein
MILTLQMAKLSPKHSEVESEVVLLQRVSTLLGVDILSKSQIKLIPLPNFDRKS